MQNSSKVGIQDRLKRPRQLVHNLTELEWNAAEVVLCKVRKQTWMLRHSNKTFRFSLNLQSSQDNWLAWRPITPNVSPRLRGTTSFSSTKPPCILSELEELQQATWWNWWRPHVAEFCGNSDVQPNSWNRYVRPGTQIMLWAIKKSTNDDHITRLSSTGN
jgi:hypothetical protein